MVRPGAALGERAYHGAMSGLHRRGTLTLRDSMGDVADLQSLEAILEAATRISARASEGELTRYIYIYIYIGGDPYFPQLPALGRDLRI